MAAPPSNASDGNALLVKLCVKVLSSVAPTGMTTKELAAELDKEVVPGFNGISSSILSSKLNAVFRRSHNDSQYPSNEQLAELPLTRSQSSEVPRRLVYRYSPPETAEAKPKAESSSAKHKNVSPEKEEESESEPDFESEPAAQQLATPEEESISSGDDANEPLTPKEDSSEATAWPSAKKRRHSGSDKAAEPAAKLSKTKPDQIAVTSGSVTPECPNTPPSTTSGSSRKAQALCKPPAPKFNLYYDAVGYDAVAATFSATVTDSTQDSQHENQSRSESDLDSWAEFASPESLGLHELDKLVC